MNDNAVTEDFVLPAIYGDNMVIQRNSSITFRGTAAGKEKISASASWGADANSVADNNGRWSFKLDTPPAGGPFTITIQGVKKIELKNILSGDVWLCAGQSNMAMPIKSVNDQEKIYEGSENIRVRIFKTETFPSPEKLEDTRSCWQEATLDSLAEFGAVPYCFGKNVSEEMNIPIGLVQSAVGGTCIESWTPLEIQPDGDFLKSLFDRYSQSSSLKNCPGYLYNGMIAPLIPFKLKGILWYQGEHNANNGVARAKRYIGQLKNLIDVYRDNWQDAELPFYMVQLPNYGEASEEFVKDCNWSIVRESIADIAMNYKNSGMIVTVDIGDAKDIHPQNKLEVGKRLADLVLHKTYKRDRVTAPQAMKCSFENNSAIIYFENGGSPLAESPDGLTGFKIEDSAGNILEGHASLKDKKTVFVKSDEIKNIKAVYYAWAKNPKQIGLFNKAGIPASPFRFENKNL